MVGQLIRLSLRNDIDYKIAGKTPVAVAEIVAEIGSAKVGWIWSAT
jgi:hypothetical protein